MEIFDLDPMTVTIFLGMVAGIVEFLKHAWSAIFEDWHEWRTCAIIAVAGITGALTALGMGADVLMGAVIGFAASGYITIAQNVGKK